MERGEVFRTSVLLILESCINNLSGTDGCRVLCHQFSTSSLLLLAHCISGCNTFWQQMKYFREAPLLFSSTDDQGQNIRTTVFPLNSGRQSYIVWWSKRNRSAPWQPRMAFRMKRSVASCVLLRESMYSKKCNGPTCRDGYARRVVLRFSRTDPLHSKYHGTARGNFSFQLQRIIPIAVQPTSKVIGVAGPLTLHGGDTGPGLAAIPSV